MFFCFSLSEGSQIVDGAFQKINLYHKPRNHIDSSYSILLPWEQSLGYYQIDLIATGKILDHTPKGRILAGSLPLVTKSYPEEHNSVEYHIGEIRFCDFPTPSTLGCQPSGHFPIILFRNIHQSDSNSDQQPFKYFKKSKTISTEPPPRWAIPRSPFWVFKQILPRLHYPTWPCKTLLGVRYTLYLATCLPESSYIHVLTCLLTALRACTRSLGWLRYYPSTALLHITESYHTNMAFYNFIPLGIWVCRDPRCWGLIR